MIFLSYNNKNNIFIYKYIAKNIINNISILLDIGLTFIFFINEKIN